MTDSTFAAPSLEAMAALMPAYEFQYMLSSNQAGAVYQATQKSMDRKVAIKLFAPSFGKDKAFMENFRSRKAAVADLRHPNLINLYDARVIEDMPYLVMEYVQGKALLRSMKGGNVELALSLQIVSEVCSGLAFAHDQDLVHGHLSPLSILLNPQTTPKIAGFGLGRAIHTAEDSNAAGRYVAPEVLKGAQVTLASDVYSAGVLFYELVTGSPFRQGGPMVSELEGVPTELDRVIQQATNADPKQRHADAREFIKKLRRAASGKSELVAAAPADAPVNAPADVPAQAPAEVKKVEEAPLKPALVKESTDHTPLERAKAAGRELVRQISDSSLLTRIVVIVVLLLVIQQVWTHRGDILAARDNRNGQQSASNDQGEEEIMQLELARPLSADTQQPQTQVPQPPPASQETFTGFPEVAESPDESLDRLRSALVEGNLSEMPIGTVRQGSSYYFMVNRPMTWRAAASFAHAHGGHLALPDEDMDWREQEPMTDKEFWVGAAKAGTSHTRVDGSAWGQGDSVSGDEPYVYLNANGGFASAAVSELKPFVIQWHQDGSNPATLEKQLAATKASLAGSNPVYPPGTLALGERRYLVVEQSTTWAEARELAQAAGGDLMVLSSPEESEQLTRLDAHANGIPMLWLGGHLKEDLWRWANEEPWTAVQWGDEASASLSDAAMVFRTGTGIAGLNASSPAQGFVIEWSKDAQTNRPDGSAPSIPSAAILADKATELLGKAMLTREEAHARNTGKIAWDMDAHMRGLSRSAQEHLAPEVEKLKACVRGNRLLKETVEQEAVALTPFMAKLCNYVIDKQAKIDAEHAEEVRTIHAFYLAKLAEIRDQAQAAGQVKVQLDATRLIDEAQNLELWVDRMEPPPPPPPEEPEPEDAPLVPTLLEIPRKDPQEKDE